MISDRSQHPISVVLLAHNEAEVIEDVVRSFYGSLVVENPKSELIVAEDGSTDGTKEILARLIEELPQLRWEEGKEKLGYVGAFKNAMNLPNNEFIVFCDCSGKHDPSDAWKMYELMDEADLVIGYKVKRADPFYRVVLGKGFNFVVNSYFGVKFKDIDCPLRMFKKSVFQKLAATTWYEKALVNFELTLRFHFAGHKVMQVPVSHRARVNGPSRGLPLQKIPKVIKNVLLNFSRIKAEIC